MKINTLQAKFSESLAFAQKMLPGEEYAVEERTVSAECLAAAILAEDRKSVYRFCLGNYKVTLYTRTVASNQCYYLKLLVDHNGKRELAISDQVFYTKGMYANEREASMEGALDAIGAKPNLLMANPAQPSLIGLIVRNISRQGNKVMPLRFNRLAEINELIKQGATKTLRQALRAEYAEQKSSLIPEARYALLLLSLECLRKCEKVAA